MNTKEAILYAQNSAHTVMMAYLEDLTDEDLMVRPVPGANHAAWQLGHLISSENAMMNIIKPGASPELPSGFVENHARDKTSVDDRKLFLTKVQYVEIYNKQRAATQEILSSLSTEDLAKPTPEKIRNYAATFGEMMCLQGTHEFMHSGQVAVIRRKLGKKVVI